MDHSKLEAKQGSLSLVVLDHQVSRDIGIIDNLNNIWHGVNLGVGNRLSFLGVSTGWVPTVFDPFLNNLNPHLMQVNPTPDMQVNLFDSSQPVSAWAMPNPFNQYGYIWVPKKKKPRQVGSFNIK